MVEGKNIIEGITVSDFRKLTAYLEALKYPYHTYQLTEDKLLKVVLRGLPDIFDEAKIIEELRAMGFDAISVHRMRSGPNRTPIPFVLVALKKSDAAKKIFDLRYVLQCESPSNFESFSRALPSLPTLWALAADVSCR